jgi:hypothetical protein
MQTPAAFGATLWGPAYDWMVTLSLNDVRGAKSLAQTTVVNDVAMVPTLS